MRPNKPFLLWHALLVLLLVSIGASSAHAQRGLPMTTVDAASKARAVANVRVLAVEARSIDGNIYTFVDFRTLSVAKGDVPDHFTYRMLGGRIGDVEIAGGDDLKFAVGDELVVFLGPEFSSDGYPTLFARHLFRVSTRGGVKYVTPTPTGFTAADTRGGPVNAASPARLDDLLSAVKRLK